MANELLAGPTYVLANTDKKAIYIYIYIYKYI